MHLFKGCHLAVMWILPPLNSHCMLRKMVAVLIIKYNFAHGELIVLEVAQSSYFLLFPGKNCSCLFCSLWTLRKAEESCPCHCSQAQNWLWFAFLALRVCRKSSDDLLILCMACTGYISHLCSRTEGFREKSIVGNPGHQDKSALALLRCRESIPERNAWG